MKNKYNKILILFSVVLFLIIYPYTKVIKLFRADDVSWDVINQTQKYKKVDFHNFQILPTYNFSTEVLEMDGKMISINGFVKKEKHGNHTDIILTETVTDVCFMCNHDEHYNMILLKPKSEDTKLFGIKDDTYIKVKGIFKINENKGKHIVYQLNNVELEEVLNGN